MQSHTMEQHLVLYSPFHIQGGLSQGTLQNNVEESSGSYRPIAKTPIDLNEYWIRPLHSEHTYRALLLFAIAAHTRSSGKLKLFCCLSQDNRAVPNGSRGLLMSSWDKKEGVLVESPICGAEQWRRLSATQQSGRSVISKWLLNLQPDAFACRSQQKEGPSCRGEGAHSQMVRQWQCSCLPTRPEEAGFLFLFFFSPAVQKNQNKKAICKGWLGPMSLRSVLN